MTFYNNEAVVDESSLVMDFDTSEAEPRKFDPLPDGDYPVVIEKVSVKDHKNGSGRAANFQLKVTDGDHKGRVIFDGIGVYYKDADTDIKKEQAQQIGRAQLAGLLEAIGKKGERDLAQTVQSECIARLKTQPAQGEYDARNVVRGYKALYPTQNVVLPEAPLANEKKKPGFLDKKKTPPTPPTLAR